MTAPPSPSQSADDPEDAPALAVEAAWDTLAPAYDTLTGFHDHEAWAEQLEGLALAAGLTGRRLLDAGCGTGASTAAMRERGYDVVGVDISARMLERAAERLGPDVQLHRHDLRELPVLGRFDVVWSVSDTLNFVLTEDGLARAFGGFARNLAPGGLAVFDVDTLNSFRTLYRSLLVMPTPDRVVIFEGRAERPPNAGDVAEATIDSLVAADPPWWRRVRAIHRQRHHDRTTVERALAHAGLRLVDVWGTDGAGGSEQPLDEERHNKAVYIAQAAAPETKRR